ncbi:hypothetical protein [Sciscionella sediminilitoris]|uniref:hypothetical protein n=1 Tax=Sciscionella sediminilitoris TaxID=1445613 RepID=UPI00068C50FC|nr:hypothetical protein [Sciscionella sp. SE31]
MRTAAAFCLAVLLTLTMTGASPAAQTRISVDGSAAGRTFDGLGALSAGASSRLLIDYPEPQRSQILDYLFKPGYGANIQLLKIEIGGDTNSTDGSEPSHERAPGAVDCGRGYEWWLAEQAVKRNPGIKLGALTWGTPGWVGKGKQTVWTNEFIDYQLSWMRCAKQHHLNIDYLGGWNEKGNDPGWYTRFRAALDEHGYRRVKLVADDSFNWDVLKDMGKDKAFARAVDVVGQHYPCGYLTEHTDCTSPKEAKTAGKPLWASEQGSQRYDLGATALARSINRGYTDGRMTGNINWALEWSAYKGLPFDGDGLLEANEPWSGHYALGASVWVLAQTTQFTAPGWRYLDSGSTRIPGGSVVSLREPKGADWSSIAETLNAKTPQRLAFQVSNGLSDAPVHVRATKPDSDDPRDWFTDAGTISPQNGKFAFTAEPGMVYSFSTKGGQGKGSASAPAAHPWQLPYSEDFEHGPTPRYLSDLGGSFANAPCTGRSGHCLRQEVDRQPVQWNKLHNAPKTVIGDPDWTDYTVGVDARLAAKGTVDLGARVVNGTSGYHLLLNSDGGWQLVKRTADGTQKSLKEDRIGSGNGWHRLELRPRGARVTATVDGKQLATVADPDYTIGQVSLGVDGWQHAEFDNLRVTR